MPYIFFKRALLGNIAELVWFIPFLTKFIHQLRGVRFNNRKSVFMAKGVVIDNRYPHLIFIGEDVWLTRNVVILSHSFVSNFHGTNFSLKEQIAETRIEKGAFIGIGSIVLPGVVIGEGSYIGAGSVVTNSIPAGMLAAGNPCRVIRSLHKVF